MKTTTRTVSGIAILLSVILPAPAQAREPLECGGGNVQQQLPGPGRKELPPGAEEVAGLIGVLPLLERLDRLPENERRAAGGPMSLEALTVRQQIIEAMIATSLEVDGVIAEIDGEIAQAREVRSYLESRRDHRIGVNTIANLVTGGGVGVFGQLLQIKNNTAGNIVGAVAGGASSLLTVLALRQQQGGRQSLGIAPNMLAKLFDRKPEFHSDYPEVVWRYLNSSPPAEQGTESRRERLIREWTQLGRIGPAGTPKAQSRIDLLTSSVSTQRGQSIDVLADREMMLADVRAGLSLMKRDLGRLATALRER